MRRSICSSSCKRVRRRCPVTKGLNSRLGVISRIGPRAIRTKGECPKACSAGRTCLRNEHGSIARIHISDRQCAAGRESRRHILSDCASIGATYNGHIINTRNRNSNDLRRPVCSDRGKGVCRRCPIAKSLNGRVRVISPIGPHTGCTEGECPKPCTAIRACLRNENILARIRISDRQRATRRQRKTTRINKFIENACSFKLGKGGHNFIRRD